MSGTRFAGGHRDGDPGKTIDSLTDGNGCRRLGIHVVDRHEDVVGIIVGDPERELHHIVPHGRGADQECQQKTEDDGGLTEFTHTPSQCRCEQIYLSKPRVDRRECRGISTPAAQITVEILDTAHLAGLPGCIAPHITVETSADLGDIDRQRAWVSLAAN
jgi:hypothetical protein